MLKPGLEMITSGLQKKHPYGESLYIGKDETFKSRSSIFKEQLLHQHFELFINFQYSKRASKEYIQRMISTYDFRISS